MLRESHLTIRQTKHDMGTLRAGVDKHHMDDSGSRTTQSVDRALALLRLLSSVESDLTLNDFVRETGLHKSTVHRLLASLQEAGLVQRDASTARYRLGLELIALGGHVLGRIEVLRIADPHARRLADLTQETVNIGIRHKNDILNIEQIPGPNLVRSFDWIGKRSPLHVGAAAKALLAYLNDDEIHTYLRDVKASDSSFDDAALTEEIEQIRASGFAVNRGQLDPSVTALGAPIFRSGGEAIASISVAGYRTSIEGDRFEELAACVRTSAQDISRQLGHHIAREAQLG
jgi:DNA-binding IclR family transcriptional regulator